MEYCVGFVKQTFSMEKEHDVSYGLNKIEQIPLLAGFIY